MTSDFWPIDLLNHSGLSVISITLSSQAIYHFMEAQWAYLLRNTVKYTHSLHSIEQSWTRYFTKLMHFGFTIWYALIKSLEHGIAIGGFYSEGPDAMFISSDRQTLLFSWGFILKFVIF